MRALFVFGLAACANAQSEMRNTITFSGGLAYDAGTSCCGDSATNVAVTYAYRLFPHVDVEAGVDATLPLGTEARGAYYDFKAVSMGRWPAKLHESVRQLLLSFLVVGRVEVGIALELLKPEGD